jgi:hypothetical protein
VAALPLPSSLPMPPLTPSPAPAPRPAPRVAAQKIEAAHKPADEVEHPPVLANTHGRKEEGHAQVASAKTKAPEPNRVDSARTPVLYVARPARAEQPPETSPRPTDTQQVAKPKPNWTLVGTPTQKFALIAVSGGGGQTVLPVQVGQKLPDGSVLEAVQPGQISTSAGPYFTHH